MNKAVFLDRDGIIVKNIGEIAPTKAEDLELIPESLPIIKKIQNLGYKIIIVSNQPDVALGIIDESTKDALIKKFEELLIKNNITLDGIYYCFHHPNGIVKKYIKVCNCKKPKPGLILKTMREHKIDPDKSYMIGDRASDIKAGNLAGIKTILMDPENSEVDYLLQYSTRPDFTIKKISDALDIINS